MAYRGLLRQPAKRMLIFFNVDQTTAVLETTKVKRVLQGDMIKEGATVLVDFGKEEFEASVVKLHDDPSVLLEAETEFLIQMFGDENDEFIDKENIPPNTPTPGKKPISKGKNTKKAKSVSPKGGIKRTQPKESGQSKAKKPKKIITIEAEALPDEDDTEDDNTKENEKKKEPLSFLHEAEQEKVRKLVSQYQKIGETEVGTQTDFGTHSKDVGVQKNGNEQPKCSCHDVLLEKVTSLEKRIEQLVSAIEHPINKPGYPKSSDVFSSINQSNFDSFDSLDEEPSVMQTISEVASICANRTLPGMAETLEETAVLTTSFVAPPVCAISPSIYDDMFKKSSSISNYAKNLVFSIFDKEELVDCNCSGTYEKKALESDPRMDLIKESTFKKFPTEDRKKSWASCRKAIDSAIRKLRFKAS